MTRIAVLPGFEVRCTASICPGDERPRPGSTGRKKKIFFHRWSVLDSRPGIGRRIRDALLVFIAEFPTTRASESFVSFVSFVQNSHSPGSGLRMRREEGPDRLGPAGGQRGLVRAALDGPQLD